MTDDADFKAKVRLRMQHTGENFTTACAALRAKEPPTLPPLDDLTADDRAYFIKTARSFFQGARLTSLPLKRRPRVVVLLVLLHRFEPQRDYPESEVNEILFAHHEDFAFLRRELIDYGYLTRTDGIYRVADQLPERSANVAQEVPDREAAFFAATFHRE